MESLVRLGFEHDDDEHHEYFHDDDSGAVAVITFGGVPLLVPDADGELAKWICANYPLELYGLFPTVRKLADYDTDWNATNDRAGLGSDDSPNWTPTLNSLYWPNKAAKFACGLFLVTDSGLNAILSQNSQGNGPLALPLKMGDDATDADTGTIATSLYALPARPITGLPANRDGADEALWLLPLVDERYWWQYKNTGDHAVTPTTTWPDYVAALAAILGITITIPTTPGAGYLYPDVTELQRKYDSIGQLIDAAAESFGTRFIRRMDGTCHLLTADEAEAELVSNADGVAAETASEITNGIAGGTWRLLGGTPSQVKIAFPKYSDHALWNQGQACVLTKNHPSYISDTVSGHYQTIYAALWADFSRDSNGSLPTYPANCADLDALAELIAADYYAWHYAKFTFTLAGLADWRPSGYEEAIVWEFGRPTSDGLVARTLIWTPPHDTQPVRNLCQASDLYLLNLQEQAKAGGTLGEGYWATATVYQLTDGAWANTGKTVKATGTGGFAASGDWLSLSVEWDSLGAPYWVALVPDGGTTSTSTTTTSPILQNECAGECKFTGDADLHWSQTSDGCSTSTTSSSTSTSTTASPCEACANPTTSTSTSTTGELTCYCAWPTFCPESEGECTYTNCTEAFTLPPACGSTSSTTTCDCSTTTTSTTTTADGSTSSTTTSDCPGQCIWAGPFSIFHSVGNAVPHANSGILLFDPCGDGCGCAPLSVEESATMTACDDRRTTNCRNIVVTSTTSSTSTTTTMACVPCTGNCVWEWIAPVDELAGWMLCVDSCSRFSLDEHGVNTCQCTLPGFTGVDGLKVSTPCGSTSACTTAALGCPESCYTTTSTTSTSTTTTCAGGCSYYQDCSGGNPPVITLLEDRCPCGRCVGIDEYVAYLDSIGATYQDCDGGNAYNGPNNLNFCYGTSSTTTTSAGCGAGECIYSTDGMTWNLDDSTCVDPCACREPPYDPHESCETAHVPCSGSTSSTTTASPTTTTSTSTTTTAAPTCGGTCTLLCNGTVWVYDHSTNCDQPGCGACPSIGDPCNLGDYVGNTTAVNCPT